MRLGVTLIIWVSIRSDAWAGTCVNSSPRADLTLSGCSAARTFSDTASEIAGCAKTDDVLMFGDCSCDKANVS